MMRGGNREARRMMDKMGVDVIPVPNVQEVIIRTDKKELVIAKPDVSEMKSKEGSVYTVAAGNVVERELEVPVFSEEDVDMVSQQAGVDKERATSALAETDGDLARAILLLTTG